jgi:hypothetical protein
MITAKNFWLWFGGIWLFCGSPFLIIGLSIGAQHFYVNKRLAAEGRTVDGMVLTKAITYSSSNNSSRGGSGNSTYHVTFRFLTRSALVTGEAEVAVDAWDALVEREPIRVTYLPDAPQHHWVEGQASGWWLPATFTVMGGIFTSLGGFILLRARSRMRTREQVQREGVTTEAIVVELRWANIRINRVQQCLLRYRYQDDRGTSHTGTEHLSPDEADAWKEGDTGTVRYDPRLPNRSVWIGKP